MADWILRSESTLPKRRFTHPEDAIKQIRMGLESFENLFGYRPKGMWPSEGSVSEDVVKAIRDEGIHWIATDEEVLARSLHRGMRSHEGYLTDPEALYRPYTYNDVSIVFRDHKLSDLIGFVYSGWDAGKAVDDFMGKLLQIRSSLPKDRPFLVPIILDGENAWEYYRNDGRDFLRGLYQALSNDGRFRAVTISEYLQTRDKGTALQGLHAGSWINANFAIWLGHEEDNLAWDYLAQTREDLEDFSRENPEKDLSEAWAAIYAAEGSDWNWWYGDEHATETQSDFDELFRRYLMQVYKVMGKEIPPNLHIPILLEDRGVAAMVQPRGFIHPTIDGLVTSYFEWIQGAFFDVKRSGGSMHKSESLITSLHYGFSTESLFIRVDPSLPFTEIDDDLTIRVNIIFPSVFRIDLNFGCPPSSAVLKEKGPQGWQDLKELPNVAAVDIFEIEIPFADLRVKEGEEVHFSVEIMRHGEEAERCPWRGFINITVPTADYETLMWY
ncbi:MAG: hypothetical protein HGA78_12295 [Nitrospirales bacterium]|nr:hypothetical protein [Nitrospirales bacterium]